MSAGAHINDNAVAGCYVAMVRGSICLKGREIDRVAVRHAAMFASENTGVACIPPDWLARRRRRDGSGGWHVTLLTKSEVRAAADHLHRMVTKTEDDKQSSVGCEGKVSEEDDFDTVEKYCREFIDDRVQLARDWFVLGLGRDPGRQAYFLVLAYPRGEALRRKLGLLRKDFHITLGFGEGGDVHGCQKGIQSLVLLKPGTPEDTFARPSELVEAAQELMLGGKPSAVIGNNEKEKDFRGAALLLDAAEAKLTQQHSLGGRTIGEDTIDAILGLDGHTLKIVRDILLMRCQSSGRKHDFESVVEGVDLLLATQMRIEEVERHIMGGGGEEHRQVEASALGYKGYSLATMKRYADALPCLERSYELRTKPKGGVASIISDISPVTFAGRQQSREAITVEQILAVCCQAMGVNAPLPPLTKFPRTTHLFDAGGTAVSSDDLVISGDSDLLRIIGDGETQVIVEEKIDGANMGLSLSASGEVIAQNRSHYVSSGDHSQFSPLTSWIEQHRSVLVKILTPPDHTSRATSHGLILFGEWMVARHSLPYHKLPGHFVAFDLYDRLEKKFYSRTRLHSALRGSGIPIVPVIAVRTFGPYMYPKCGGTPKTMNALKNDLRDLLETKSRFRSDGGFVEGVVLRIEERSSTAEPQWLGQRVKIVRPDFVAGCNEGHWMRRSIEKQVVDQAFSEEYLSTESYSLAHAVDAVGDSSGNMRNGGLMMNYKDGEQLCSNEAINPRRRLTVSYGDVTILLPRNFSWLFAGGVAMSSTPREASHIAAFKAAFGISLVVTLTEESPLPNHWFDTIDGCENLFVPTQNFMAPSIEQVDDIMNRVKQTVLGGGAVLIHCGGGKGRAGTVAACLLLRFGRAGGIRATIAEEETAKIRVGAKLTSDDAIEYIQRIRPGSIETEIQEQFIRQYARLLWKRASVVEEECHQTGVARVAAMPMPAAFNRNPKQELESAKSQMPVLSAKQIKSEAKAERERLAAKLRAQRRAPRSVILMGLPGSGKSTFAARLAASSSSQKQEQKDGRCNGNSWVVINQDRLGKRACLELAGRKAGARHRVILDRCNATAADRKEWLEILHSPPKGETSLVCFTADSETCISRVEKRKGHETIPEGRGRRIVSDMSRILEPPSRKEREHLFGSVHFVNTSEETHALLRIWGAD